MLDLTNNYSGKHLKLSEDIKTNSNDRAYKSANEPPGLGHLA